MKCLTRLFKKKKREHKPGTWGNRPFPLLDKMQEDIENNPELKALHVAWKRGDFEPENHHSNPPDTDTEAIP